MLEWLVFSIISLIIIGAVIGIIYKKKKGELGDYDYTTDDSPGGLGDLPD
jgi:hypothetical protein